MISSLDKSYKYYIDFDGVILDSVPYFLDTYAKYNLENYEDVFLYTDLDEVYHEKNQINNSLDILREVQDRLDITILTKYTCPIEKERKINFLKEQRIIVPIIFVPYNDKKSSYTDKNKMHILVDDQDANIEDINSNGGKGIKFSIDNENNSINSLSFLLEI